jgi:hypothetical protein
MKSLGVILFVLILAGPMPAQAPSYSFMGNKLGMSLDAFKAANSQDHFWVNTGDPSKRLNKKNTKILFTPACTDTIRGFPGDSGDLQPGEVLCNPAPTDLNTMYRQFAGITAVQVIYNFYSGKLYAIQIAVNAADYKVARDAFIAKYGAGFSRSSQDFENGFGARWDGEILLWRSGGQAIEMKEGSANGPGQDSHDAAHPSVIAFVDSAFAPPTRKSPIVDF